MGWPSYYAFISSSVGITASAPFRVVIIDAALFANVSIFLFFPKDIKIIFFIFLSNIFPVIVLNKAMR